MNIKIITVGKLKEKYLKMGIEEYAKRLKSYCKLEMIELADEKAPENLSEMQMKQIKEKEGQRILSKIKEDEFVFELAIHGTLPSSEELAEEIRNLGTHGKSKITFIIGGSLGTSEEVSKRADKAISFGRLTYPHQLMRLILTEQIYRVFRINAGEPYHK
ncbi:23S rRNA (pseudouridine1915-N3)-methyltransferase [Pilibacter termitis]|uniref:Ribosomal RNA large subunit methyltransferase H n=1 Tax=Pilibacter termitis TaxID=263852 RepID=A0A1T4QE10_9ENTE|nr:23S rRNA (pseudouridine(1915)-N(3))-methyltransferase RlmH [Pilibacter termitis]SKA02040.1 23S rRNA (pseudouridine1915-N3)-methyltransferase [Pilibacter termitis]